MANIPDITDETFAAEVLRADTPVLVDFWAPWCGPCRMLGATLEEISAERAGKVKFVKINIDEYQENAMEQRVMMLPTVVLFNDGAAVGRLTGGVPPRLVNDLLDQHLAAVAEAPAASADQPSEQPIGTA